MIIFLPISLNICFGCSKEPSHRDGLFEYPQHMFWLRNKKNNILVRTHIWRPGMLKNECTYRIFHLTIACDLDLGHTDPELRSQHIVWLWWAPVTCTCKLILRPGLKLWVCTKKLFFLFLNQNICCGYSKEPCQWDNSFEHPKHVLKLMSR